MRDDLGWLQDMLVAVEKIESYVGTNRTAFYEDELLQVWVIHHLQTLGEAANRLPQTIRDRYSQFPWSQIIGMRNILVHNYFGVDIDVVWAVIERDLPILKPQIETIILNEQANTSSADDT